MGKFDKVSKQIELIENFLKTSNLEQKNKTIFNAVKSLMAYTKKRLAIVDPNLIFDSYTINNIYNLLNKLYNDLGRQNFNINELAQIRNAIASLPIILEKETSLSLDNILSEYKNSADKSISELKNKINEIEGLKNNLSDDVSIFEKKVEEKLNKLNSKIDELEEKLKLQAEETLEQIKRMEEDARRLMNVIGKTVQTGKYKETADYHRKQAQIWRWIALFFMITAIGMVGYLFIQISSGQYEWHNVLIRILMISIILYPATYASKESSKHRQLETFNRKYELDLASLNPFIELLSEEDKREIKKKMVDKLFGNNNSILFTKETGEDENSVSIDVNVLEKIISMFSKFIKIIK